MKTKNIILTSILIIILGMFYSCQEDINPQLEVVFVADSHEVTAGSALTFTDESLGGPTRWDWVFEGGTPSISELTQPIITYNEPGTYSVQLMIGRGNDSISVIKDAFITVGYGQVNADFSASDLALLQDQSISFTDLSVGIPTSWAWEFTTADGGTTITSSEQNPTITFSVPGIYTVKLTVSNPVSTDDEVKTGMINIIDASSVEADFSAQAQSTYEGSTISFIDETLGTVTQWEWIFEGGSPETSTEQNPTITYNTAGRYKVKLIATNSYKSSVKEVEDYILVVPGNGLVAFYPFDGSGDDVGPYSINTIKQEPTGTVLFDIQDRMSKNFVASFDGSTGLIAPDNAAMNFDEGDFSVSVWIKTGVAGKMMLWIESGNQGATDNEHWFRIGDNTTSRQMRWAVYDGLADPARGSIINGNIGVADDTWHHIVATRSGITSNIYIDGELKFSKESGAVPDVSNNQNLKIGVQETAPDTYGNHYTGLMDEFIMYDRALTDQEIADLFGL